MCDDLQIEEDDGDLTGFDSLRTLLRQRRHNADRTILTAAKIISPAIADSFSQGYKW